MRRTDHGEMFNYQCYVVQRIVGNGQMECGADLCPADCDICKFCLYYVADCHTPLSSLSPSFSSSDSLIKLSLFAPSATPTISYDYPSSEPSSDSTQVLSSLPSSCPLTHPSSSSSTMERSSPPSIEHSDLPSIRPLLVLSSTPSRATSL